MLKTWLGVILILLGLAMVIFRRRFAASVNATDRDVLQGRQHPVGSATPFQFLLSGLGMLAAGLYLLFA